MVKEHKNIWLVIVILAAGLAAVWLLAQNRPTASPSDGRLKVVATFFPLYDFTKNIGGDKIDLQILFTQTPEVASLIPSDIAKINRADLIIKNGVGFEPILEDLLKSSDNQNIVIVDTSEGVKLLASEKEENPQGDPHIWLDPQNAIKQVANIRDALMKSDSPNADFYQQNAIDYAESLKRLDEKLAQELGALQSKDFVAFHSAFSYLAQRYGLNQAAVIEEFPGKEPSPRYLAEVIKTIRNLKITALFAEPQFSPKVLEVIARDLGLRVRELNPIESGDLQKDSYFSIMEKNSQILKETLK